MYQLIIIDIKLISWILNIKYICQQIFLFFEKVGGGGGGANLKHLV